ncbi:MAG: outer membrane protein transport protein [Candidatus Latescibacter sp.]|nr:outer membrane protein transport protein [Candidatus Latescibacter sp.]
MKNIRRILVLFLALIAFVTAGPAVRALAQEVVTDNDIGAGARAMGMGGAQIAASEDISAVAYNPAALTRLKLVEFQLGLNFLRKKIDTSLYSSKGIGSANATTDFSGLGALGLAYPIPTDRGSLVFGIAYNRVKDFTGRFRAEGYSDVLSGNYTGESIESGGLGMYSLAGAVDVSPNVSVGASIDIWSGNYKRDSRQLLNDPTKTYSQLDLTGADDNIQAVSLKPAFLYFIDNFRLGGYVRLPMTFHIDEDNYQELYSRSDGKYFQLREIIDPTSSFTDDSSAQHLNYRIDAPMQFGLGAALGGPGKTVLAFDISYQDWTQAMLKYPSDYAPDPTYFLDKYRNTATWSVGIEQPLPRLRAVVRAGYMRNPLIFKGPRGTEAGAPPISVTNERDYLTLGFGAQLDPSFGVDVGYAHGFWTEEEGPRTDKESHNNIFLSINYRSPLR